MVNYYLLPMEINFKDKKLKDLCEQAQLAQRNLGSKMARKLQARLADLLAAPSVAELPQAGRPHPLRVIGRESLRWTWFIPSVWFSSQIIIQCPERMTVALIGVE